MSDREEMNSGGQPTPRWKRIAALIAAILMVFLTFSTIYAMATGQLFWF